MKLGLVGAALVGASVLSGAQAAGAATPCPVPPVVAHRGDSSQYTQETYSAYAGAYSANVRVLDADVRFTRTGVPVLLHDPTLDAFRSGKQISSVSLHYAKSLRSSTGARILTLWQFARFLKKHPKTAAQIELKVDPSAYQWKLIDNRLKGLGGRVRLASFDAATVRDEQRHGYQTGLISVGPVAPKVAKRYGSVLYLWYSFATSKYAAALKRVGVSLYAWTVDDPSQWGSLPRGVGVITDSPKAYLRWQRTDC